MMTEIDDNKITITYNFYSDKGDFVFIFWDQNLPYNNYYKTKNNV